MADVKPLKLHNNKLKQFEASDQIPAANLANAVSDAAYGSGWDGVTTIAPSKNAVYDKFVLVQADIDSKLSSADVKYVKAMASFYHLTQF